MKRKIYKKINLIFPLIATIMLLWSLFEFSIDQIKNTHLNSIQMAIEEILSNEKNIINPYDVARSIEGLEKNKLIKCTQLELIEHGRPPFLYMDLSYRAGCKSNFSNFFTLNKTKTFVLPSINGQSWKIKFIPHIPLGLGLTAWCLRLITLISLILGPLRLLKLDQEKHKLHLKELELEQDKYKMARQIAHDIRSPLTALDMLIKTASNTNGPEILNNENNKLIAQKAIKRIHQMAELLLKENRPILHELTNKEGVIQENLNINLDEQHQLSINSLIRTIVFEKDFHARRNHIEIIYNPTELYLKLYSKIDGLNFQRAISNLLTNAIEAFENLERDRKIVKIEFHGPLEIENNKKDTGLFLEIEISDNASGIPKDLLFHLNNNAGYSLGKKSGHGLGSAQSYRAITANGGNIRYQSTLGLGTSVFIQLPLSEAPSYFVEKLEYTKEQKIFVIDNDPSLFDVIAAKFTEAHITTFTDPYDFINWFNHTHNLNSLEMTTGQFNTALNDSLIFIDFDFGNNSRSIPKMANGLEFILNFKLEKNAILCTGHADGPELQRECLKNNIKLLAKMDLVLTPTLLKSKRPIFQKINVLIDDDELMRMSFQFLNKGHMAFASVEEFLNCKIPKEKISKIFIDSELGDKLPRGEILAKDLYNEGHSNIILTSGHDQDYFIQKYASEGGLQWITKIISKENLVKEAGMVS